MKKSSSSSSLPRQQQRRRSRSSSSNNHHRGNGNNMTSTRGHSPRPNNTVRRSNSNRSRRTSSADNNDNYRFSTNNRSKSNSTRSKSKSKSTKSKLHMPHIIPNISPSVLLKKHQGGRNSNTNNNNNKRGGKLSENDINNNSSGSGNEGFRSSKRRGRSSTPKDRRVEHNDEPPPRSFSNTWRRSLSAGNNRRNTDKSRNNNNINNNERRRRRSLSANNNNNSTNRNNTQGRFRRLRSFSTGDGGNNGNQNNNNNNASNVPRKRSASFQPSTRQQQSQRQYNYDDDADRFNNGKRRSASSGRMNYNSSSNNGGNTTGKQWMSDRRGSTEKQNQERQRRRRRGKSMPARFLHSMSNMTFWKKGDDDANKNNNNNTNNRTNNPNNYQHHQVPSDLDKEMKRMSSRGSRERGGKKSSTATTTAATTTANLPSSGGVKNEWGVKPRGRSRPKHSRNRSSDAINKDQIMKDYKDQIMKDYNDQSMKELDAEIGTKQPPQPPILHHHNPPPPPPIPIHPRPPPPPPFHHNGKLQQPPPNNNNTTNKEHYHRSKSLPRNFQRHHTLLDVMVEMEKEIFVPLRKPSNGSKSGNTSRSGGDFDSVISPIASMDSSWRYKEDSLLLMKSMASLNDARRGGKGGVRGVPSTKGMSRGVGLEYDSGKGHDGKMKKPQHKLLQRQQSLPQASGPHRFPPPPPPLPPPAPKAIVGDINDIDGDDEEDDEVVKKEKVTDMNDIDGDDDEDDKKEEDSIPLTDAPRRSRSASLQVEPGEDEEDPSQDTSENDDTSDGINNSEEDNGTSSASKEEEKTEHSQSMTEKTGRQSFQTPDDFTFRSSIIARPEPISSVYGSIATESPELSTTNTVEKKREPPSPSDDLDSLAVNNADDDSNSSSGGSSYGEADSLTGCASVASDEKVGSIAPPSHSSIRKKKPGAIKVGASPHGGDRSSYSMGTLSLMHNELQRKMTELQNGLDQHGRPIKELDVASVDSSTGRVSDLTLPTVLMKAPPPASRIRAMKPKPLTTRRTKKGNLELQGDIDAMKSLAVSELSMASPVQSAYPKSMSMRMTSYKKTANNKASVVPPARQASTRRTTQPKKISPIVEASEEPAVHTTFKKKSSTRSLHSRQSHGTAASAGAGAGAGTTSQMPMKPASGAGHRHAPPPPKHRPAGTKIDIGEVAQQLQVMQGQAPLSTSGSVGSGNGSCWSRQYLPKASGSNSVSSSLKHSSVEGMKWSDKFGKSGRYSGDVNADYVPNGMGSMQYDFGLIVDGRWVDGTLLSNDLNEEFAV